MHTSQLAQDPKTELVATHVDAVTREELVKRTSLADRSLSAELRRAIRAWLEHEDEGDEL